MTEGSVKLAGTPNCARPPMRPTEVAAADYIISLWGRRRRAFARAYWLHLARGMPCPSFEGCFGASRIANRLIYFAQADERWDPPIHRHHGENCG